MQFGPRHIDDALGCILAHSVRAPGLRAMKKGRVLSTEDLDALRAAGLAEVMVARLEDGDVPEDEAAATVAQALAGKSLEVGNPFTGRANLKSNSDRLLDDLADAIRQEYTGHLVTIEGHTDSDPITRSRWKSNHELSLARAMAVYHALRRRGVPEAQLAVAGFGANSPIASNRTTEGKAKNRRIEVVVEPAPAE